MNTKRKISYKRFYLKKIKNKYMLKQIFDYMETNRFMKIIKYNKNIQNILDINKNDYDGYLKTEIEIIPIKVKKKINFINISNNDEKKILIFILMIITRQ